MTGKQPSDNQFETGNRFTLWASGHSLDESGLLYVSDLVGSVMPDAQESRAVGRVQICSRCGKHFDSVRCPCEVTT